MQINYSPPSHCRRSAQSFVRSSHRTSSLCCLYLLFFASALSSLAKDYGDAPSSYGTKDDENGPSHIIIPTLFMGDLGPDDDPDGHPDPAALGDDLDNIDDEEALNNASLIFLEGESYKLVVECTNQTGNPAKLGVWVDWNRDGLFKTDALEFADADVPSAGLSQQIVVTLPPVPTGVVGGNPAGELSFIRLRLSTDQAALAEPTGAAADGEVEDWQIQMFENYDFGDLPDIGPGTSVGNYRTNLADGGPRHRLGRPVYLGQEVDGEFNAQPNASALGDDNDGSVDDEDGVSVSNLIPGVIATFSVTATNQTELSAVLRAEVDLNQNGSFLDPGEAQTHVIPVGSSHLPLGFDFAIPQGFPVGSQLATRFRISTDPLLVNDPGQTTFNDGEVEDHFFTSSAGLDWGDLPDRCPGTRAGNFDRGGILPDYQTLAIDNGPSHAITPDLTIANDTPSADSDVDAELDGQPDPAANGDDTDGNNDDLILQTALEEYGLLLGAAGAFHTEVRLGFFVSQAVNNTTGLDATFYAFFDGNRDGDFDDAGEVHTTLVPGDGSVTSVAAQFEVRTVWPVAVTWDESFALRCRISSDQNLGPNGPAPDGEVQDDIITFNLIHPLFQPGDELPEAWTPGGSGGRVFIGEDITIPLGMPFLSLTDQLNGTPVNTVENAIWSIHLDGEVATREIVDFDSAPVGNLGVGSHPVAVTFKDADSDDDYAFHFHLNVVNLPGYSAWAVDSNLLASNNRLDFDPDGDGLSNLLEFALGSRGDLPDNLPLTPVNVDGSDGDDYLSMSYPRLNGGHLTEEGYRVGELLYREQGSTDLMNWVQPTSPTVNPADLPMQPVNYPWRSFRLNTPVSGANRGFLRVQVELGCEEHPSAP